VTNHDESSAPARAAFIEASQRWSRIQKRTIYLVVFILVLSLGGLGLRRVADAHLRSMSVLTLLSNPDAQGFSTRFARHPVTEELGSAQTPEGTLQFRLYKPQGVSYPGGIVLLDGVNRLGWKEPRLINFARALAGAGMEVLTPELQDMADYHVTPLTVELIGESAVVLSAKMGVPKVGIIATSFGGGLSLLAATKPDYADRIGFVVAIGAHDDMGRVARFFAANMIEKPDGSMVPFQAHEYGVLLLAYTHMEDFFSPTDAPVARMALRQWLWEQPAEAMKTAEALSPAGRQQLDQILHHRDLMQQGLFREIERHHEEMQAVSPHGRVASLRVPVYLLHGTGDSIIPASETLWLAKDVPPPALKSVLISPALIHVDMENGVPISEKWALVDFLARVLKSADKLGRPTK
jgi:pimeloyl-ACP methyl ester carboxylesterase